MQISRAELHELHLRAREEGIATDYRLIQPSSLCRLTPLPPITDIREPFTFSSEEGLATLPKWDYPAEKLQIIKELKSIELIAAVAVACTSNDVEGQLRAVKEEEAGQIKKKPYLEEPLTRAEFGLSLNESVAIPKLRYEEFKKAEVDEAKDEGLRWTAEAKEEVRQEMEILQKERLEMDIDALRFLEEIQKLQIEQVEVKETIPKLAYLMEPLTPPLLPMPMPELPPLENFRDEVKPELAEGDSHQDLINELLEPYMKESSFPDLGASDEPLSAFVDPKLPVSSPFRRPTELEDYKIEVPLTPPKSVRKQVRFSSVVQTDEGLRLKYEDSQEGALQSLEDITRAHAMKFEQELTQEQLQEADSTLRLKVPMMDFSLGKMPWEGTQDNLQKMKDVKSWAGKAGKRWVGNKSEEFEMQWVPFRYKDVLPMLPKDDPIEDYDNDISKFIMPEREGLKAEKQLIQSLANMRFYELNDEEDEFEDELEFANFEPEPEPITPIKQIIKPRPRKFTPPLVSDNDDLILTSVREVVKKRKKTDNVPDGRVSKRPAKPPQEDDRFSAANMLRNFMAVRRGSVLPELESSIKDPSSSSSLPNIPQKPSQQPTPPTITPAPRLNPHPPRASFIVSTALLSQRSLFRRIKAVYPNATFIERDYTDPFTTASDDAELIISPKVGLIYTSLQALQQRPLPGETAAFASGATIKTRVQQLCLKYERLVIIVWNRNSIVPTPSDTAVLDDFGKFTAALGRECSLTVQHVQGPEESVAAWTACAMMNLGSWWELVEEESAWEGRLRAVGLNAFAAQAVMGMFGEDVAAFFKLGTREMMERAGGVVGERVIRRVMANLDKSLVGSERR